jgi:hypothetical protein
LSPSSEDAACLSGGGGKGVVASGGCVEVVAPMVCLESNNNGAQKNARCELTGKCHDCDGRNANQSPLFRLFVPDVRVRMRVWLWAWTPSDASFLVYATNCLADAHSHHFRVLILLLFFTMSFPLFFGWLACWTMVGQPQSRLLSLLDQNEQWINSVC